MERIERFDHGLNAVCWRRYEQAGEEAERRLPDSPLAGVPFLIKDLGQAVEGSPDTMGSLVRRHAISRHDSNLVARFKAAGLLILGKTTSSEFGSIAETRSRLHGVTRNPWDTGRSPGGSSGGSGVAVAARYTPAAHGGDGGGSIRIPASMCGVFGLKPTRARTPMGPDVGEGWFGLSVDHALTRTVRDSAALLDATSGPDPGAPYFAPPPERPFLEDASRRPGSLRIAVSADSMLGERIDPSCARAVERTAELLEGLGHRVSFACPSVDARTVVDSMLVVMATEMVRSVELAGLAGGVEPRAELFEPFNWYLARVGRRLAATRLAAAIHLLKNTARATAPFFDDHDVFVESTVGRTPWKCGRLGPDWGGPGADHAVRGPIGLEDLRRVATPLFEFSPNTPLWNVTGQPSMSVPLHWENGLPVGVQFTARYGEESLLFRLAAQLEEARPWRDRVPPLIASRGG